MNLDPNAHSYTAAAASWAMQGRLDQMRGALSMLSREQVNDAIRACTELQVELQRRKFAFIAEQAAADLGMVAEATP